VAAAERALRVGVYLPGQPPLVQTTLTGRYRGMNADYLTLIHYSLNIRITVLGYQNRADAIRALRAGEIDTVLTGLDTRPSVEEGIQLSASLVHSWPGLVTSLANVMAPYTARRVRAWRLLKVTLMLILFIRRFRMPRLPITPIIRKR
jgi:two-component system sensor histidine kinase EvgS